MSRILTGIQASGRPHLGNILGAIEPAVALSQNPENESFLFIADLHSLTTVKDAALLQANTSAVASAWLACGFDAEKNFFYRQSRLAGFHTELLWYLSCLTPYPMLANAHSFKEKSDKLSDVNAGLFTYPVLQAADIVLYQANFVPVGKDQKQHLEMSKDIAATFNRVFGEVFVLPEPLINESVMTIPGIDGQKMSKSYNNYIDIFLPEKELDKQIKRIVTDATPLEEPKNPDTCIVFKLYSFLADESQIAAMREKYIAGGYGYGHAKKEFLELILSRYKKQREVFDFYMENPEELEAKLRNGEAKAKEIAAQTMDEVRKLLKFA
ncbi:tryptophan--tRNA ligase [Lacihabitans sp. CS3-21]|jgi:tryptophanyl-tRNA synthetase|uniref:tryptophan--tRNA ligase n=1 Tax=Lacihabitans sp. CS3-21 TaxID=2487332 RepID=UPI0020CB88A8|nr:tryptophan--tRNA ligase [Lacihabitans sp. CS3-21]MCP9745886.1 tryptophan--tRNA ligase [Lacihabitans sp. CS3-21]MDP1816678.1 tryptophan--tRNA ligase [Leadbetterella sp.]